MDTTDESDDDEAYGEVEINARGRLTIPKALRDELQLEAGTTFTVVREGSDIRLVRQLPRSGDAVVGPLSGGLGRGRVQGRRRGDLRWPIGRCASCPI